MTNKIAVVAGIIFGALIIWIMYQNLVVIPKEEIRSEENAAEEARIAERFEIVAKERAYDSCIQSAYNVYSTNWDSQCELQGKEAECSLYASQYKIVEERHVSAQESCLVRFK